MSTPHTTTGKELRKAREDAGLTQTELAEEMGKGITQCVVSELESDGMRANQSHIRDIAIACGCEFRITSDGEFLLLEE